jgi:hypothetical protein
MIVYFTLKKYDLNVIPTEANEVSEVEESTELIKISRLRPGQPGLRSK